MTLAQRIEALHGCDVIISTWIRRQWRGRIKVGPYEVHHEAPTIEGLVSMLEDEADRLRKVCGQ